MLEYIETEIKNKIPGKFFNEFFTPCELIEKMLSHIPQNIWDNIHAKWLDPTCGEGYFLLIVFEKLFFNENYIFHFPKEEERKKHILQNLYFNDINPENTGKIKGFTGFKDCKMNIYTMDFLQWNPDLLFDVIIGNPPFQTPSNNYLSGPMRKGSRKKMYEKVIEHSLTFLKKDGYMSFISPTNLWSGKGALKNTLYEKLVTKYSPVYIYLNNLKKRWFPKVGQNLKMCYFVLVNEPYCGVTSIENTDGVVSLTLKNRSVNPVENWTAENDALISRFLGNKNKFIRTKEIPVEVGDVLYMQNPERIAHVLLSDKLQKDSHYGEEKYILFRMKPFEGMYDKGDYLLAPQIFFLPLSEFTKEEKKNIISFFESDIWKRMVKSTTTSQFLKGGIVDFLDIDLLAKFWG